ncbi:unnamed protein product [Bemisia tabaci]|uniref:Glucosylceramidase n=1 Tax=Bemisia tabaci TaxID=7038 RepID=A0A9P0AHW6_BEMTA|nr:unnamed protein product [Bemisia tabaci]
MFIIPLTLFSLTVTIVRTADYPLSYCSSSDGTYKLTPFDKPTPGNATPAGASTWSLTVDDTPAGRKQKVLGFGACVTDSTVAVFNLLSESKLAELLRTLVTRAGAGFNLMRHTVGCSDLSGDPAYTYDDNGGSADVNLTGFNLGDRGNAMVAMLKRMRDVNPKIKILGSPWSPPGWMKLNRKLWGTTKNNNLDHAYVDPYAQYFVKYLEAYRDGGVSVDAITIQNEPHNSRNGMPTMYIYADESGRLINEKIGPALKAAGLRTQVWAWDHNTDVPEYPQKVLDTAPSFVKTVAWHCYARNNDWATLSRFHERNPNVTQIMSECWTSPKTGWVHAADFTMGPLQNWGGGAIAWALGTNPEYGPHLSYPDGPAPPAADL